jgi:hypothetical protein
MWVESVLVVGDQILDAAELEGWALTVGACDPIAPCMLLAHVTVTEDRTSVAAYTGLTILALQGNPAQPTGMIDLARPLLTLLPLAVRCSSEERNDQTTTHARKPHPPAPHPTRHEVGRPPTISNAVHRLFARRAITWRSPLSFWLAALQSAP